MEIITIIIIAVSLSMDAFSLSLAYGTLNIRKRHILKLSVIVGIYHFFMPMIGKNLGNMIINFIKINPNIIVFIVLCFIGIQMLIESFKDKKQEQMLSIFEYLLFGFAVSVDSFSVGIGLNLITDKYLISYLLFSISSFVFTFLGLTFGKKISNLIGKLSTLIGGVTLIIIGVIYLIK